MPEQIVVNNEEPRIAIIDNKRAENFADVKQTQLYFMDVLKFLDSLPKEPIFDLVVTSPPYNIGKEYEKQMPLEEYVRWQKKIIDRIYIRLKDTGSICWQVGNYVENGSITPLDIELAPIFKKLNMQLRNRIIWHFGHGLHNQTRFSGRYEVVMWYTKTDSFFFSQIHIWINDNPILIKWVWWLLYLCGTGFCIQNNVCSTTIRKCFFNIEQIFIYF